MDIAKLKLQLCDTYKYRIEMHAHTSPASPCSQASPKEAVTIYKNLGYDAICITNHFFKELFTSPIFENMTKEEKIDKYLEDFYLAKKEGDRLGINVILGAELRFIENTNDYLIYGIDRDSLIKIYDYLDNTVEHFRNNNIDENAVPAVLVKSHGPFAWGKNASDAAKNGAILETVAKMALNTLTLLSSTPTIPQYLLSKHYLRKHGENAYYGQGK